MMMCSEEQGDRRVSVYYTGSQNDEGDSSSHQVIDLNQIDIGVESGGTPGLSSYRGGGFRSNNQASHIPLSGAKIS